MFVSNVEEEGNVMRTQKVTGDYIEQWVEKIMAELFNHDAHFTVCSIGDTPNIVQVRCLKCKHVVVEGTRELIELIWFEFQQSHGSPS